MLFNPSRYSLNFSFIASFLSIKVLRNLSTFYGLEPYKIKHNDFLNYFNLRILRRVANFGMDLLEYLVYTDMRSFLAIYRKVYLY
jgi:hypothetical protein